MNDLERLQKLIGREFDADDIICEMYDEDEYVIINRSNNNGYDYIAYYDTLESSQYLFTIDENKIITDVWEA